MEQNNFQWTDELVKEFVRTIFNRQEHNYLPFAINEFKLVKNQSFDDGIKTKTNE